MAQTSNTFFLERKTKRGRAYLVADALVPQVTAALGWANAMPLPRSKKSGMTLVNRLLKLRYARPFASDPFDNFGFLLGEHVSTTDGTGLVHTAPGHGRDDYEVVRRHGFVVDDPSLCPVDEGGFYDVNAPEFLRGKRVVIPKTPDQSANDAVLAALARSPAEASSFRGRPDKDHSGSLLLSKTSLSHSYPHCWRCKQPVIFRATHQWFIDLGALRETRDVRDPQPRGMDPVVQREPHRRDGREPPRVDDFAPAPLGLAHHVPQVHGLQGEGRRFALPRSRGRCDGEGKE